jgi:PKD repeat protein
MPRVQATHLRAVVSILIGAGALAAASSAQALNGYLTDWRDAYPNSTSDDASCQLCHGSSTDTLNAYGRDLCVNGINFVAIEGDDSDTDPTGSDNLTEIDASTQPGWSSDGQNPLYDAGGNCALVASNADVPGNVPQPYDPVVGGDPIADAAGPYDGLVGELVTFDGTGSSDDGTIVAYAWDFGDGSSGSGEVTDHVYGAEGTYTVTLTVTDNDGNTASDQTTATIADPGALDLDIAQFRVSKNVRLGRDVKITLVIQNNGNIDAPGTATVTGVQGGVEVFSETKEVFDGVGNGKTTFDFGPYTPGATGQIVWTVTVEDGDADPDEDTATTNVR